MEVPVAFGDLQSVSMSRLCEAILLAVSRFTKGPLSVDINNVLALAGGDQIRTVGVKGLRG